jgi:hypothetical protein
LAGFRTEVMHEAVVAQRLIDVRVRLESRDSDGGAVASRGIEIALADNFQLQERYWHSNAHSLISH